MNSNVLIADDHPLIVDGYVRLLTKKCFKKKESSFIKCYNCEDAYHKISFLFNQKENLNFALINTNLAPYKNIKNGIDLASLIREKFPKCEIVIITVNIGDLAIDKIIKKIVPEGFIAQNDLNLKLFSLVCKKITLGETYYSQSIIESQRNFLKKNTNWDIHDNQILSLIAEGIKTVNLPDHIPLSISAIEKRKANIKFQLLMGKGSDKDLISKAKKLGLL